MDHHSIQPLLFMMMSSFKNNDTNTGYFPIFLMLVGTIIFKLIPFDEIKDFFIDFFKSENISEVEMLFETKNIKMGSYGIIREEIVCSEEFEAISYYIEENSSKFTEIHSLTEIMTKSVDKNDKSKNKFVLSPLRNKKIKITDDNIFFELNIKKKSDEEESKNKNNNSSSSPLTSSNNQYVIRLSRTRTCSNDNSVEILNNFVNKCVRNYKNSIHPTGTKIFNFRSSWDSDGTTGITFEVSDLTHKKDLEKNIFFDGKKDLIKYIKPFVYDPDVIDSHYEEKFNKCGITFKAGILLYGKPGCGKTATIKAISSYTNRSIINYRITENTTNEEFKKIFSFPMEYKGKKYSAKELIIVMEDFDATKSKVLKTRAKNSVESIPGQELHSDFSELLALNNSVEKLSSVVKAADKKDELNLSCVLNVLDGINELHNVMVIITTNHFEDIDEAFLRTGRFDFKLELKRASQKSIVEMISNRYEITIEDLYKYHPNIKNIKDEILVPSDVCQICFKNDTIESCISQILLESQK